MITKHLKVVNISKDSNLLSVEMSQEMYQYICYLLLQKEHENKVQEVKNKIK